MKPALKKVKSDQSSLLQHFKKSTQPKTTPPPPPPSSEDSTPKVFLVLHHPLTSYRCLLFQETETIPSSSNEVVEKPKTNATSWNQIFRPPTPPPVCVGHKERCVIRQVKDTSSTNWGRYFYVCARANGASDNPQARCDHFQWKEIKKKGA